MAKMAIIHFRSLSFWFVFLLFTIQYVQVSDAYCGTKLGYPKNDSSLMHSSAYENNAETFEYLIKKAIGNFSLNGNRIETLKRSTKYHIELLVVADESMISHHGKHLNEYLYKLISMTSHRFKHPSIGQNIDIKLVKITKLKNSKSKIDFQSPDEVVNSFCRWQRSHNTPSDDDWAHFDTALFITKKNLCGTPESENCHVLGIAAVASMCLPEHSCLAVQDQGLRTSAVIAHELGHVLGLEHDDKPQCDAFYKSHKLNPEKEIMHSSIKLTSKWSACSRNFLSKFIKKFKCLKEYQTNRGNPLKPFSRFAGFFYDLNKQCEYTSKGHPIVCKNHKNACEELWCSSSDSSGRCTSTVFPWADGTPCGANMWCDNGKCVNVVESLQKYFLK